MKPGYPEEALSSTDLPKKKKGKERKEGSYAT